MDQDEKNDKSTVVGVIWLIVLLAYFGAEEIALGNIKEGLDGIWLILKVGVHIFVGVPILMNMPRLRRAFSDSSSEYVKLSDGMIILGLFFLFLWWEGSL
jgi:hypothetical protein